MALGDPVVEQAMRSLAAVDEVEDLYAESAATFLAVHLLIQHSRRFGVRLPTGEGARMQRAIAVMRERLTEPLTLADIAGEVRLSVYHFVAL